MCYQDCGTPTAEQERYCRAQIADSAPIRSGVKLRLSGRRLNLNGQPNGTSINHCFRPYRCGWRVLSPLRVMFASFSLRIAVARPGWLRVSQPFAAITHNGPGLWRYRPGRVHRAEFISVYETSHDGKGPHADTRANSRAADVIATWRQRRACEFKLAIGAPPPSRSIVGRLPGPPARARPRL